MCIGVPMQAKAVDGHFAICEGRGEQRRINTALIGQVCVGDWLLVFLNDARERIDEERAREVNAALDLVLSAMHGEDHNGRVDFDLPSHVSADQMRAWTGG